MSKTIIQNRKLPDVFGQLQKFGQALLVPVALLPAGGLLYGFGVAFSSSSMLERIPWLGTGIWPMVTKIMSTTGSIIFANIALLFAIGVAIGLAKNNDGTAGLSAVAGYLLMNQTICTLLNLNAEVMAANSSMYQSVLGIYTLRSGVIGGMFIGMAAAWAYNKYYDVELPQALGFFSGKRAVPIITSVVSILIGALMCIVWPPIQNGMDALSHLLLEQNPGITVFIYGVVVKILNPIGLHTPFITPFLYQLGSYTNLAGEVIQGDKLMFFAQLADGVPVTAGIFSPGPFAMDMFGCWGGALAIVLAAKPEKRKMTAGIMFSACITSFLTGITEPWLFAFLFCAPACWLAFTVINGAAYFICYHLGIRLSTNFACGVIDFILMDVLNNAPRWYLIVPVGIFLAVVEFFSFSFLIRKFNYKTPGREDDETASVDQITNPATSGEKYEQAVAIVNALGGVSNISEITCCATRLRVIVIDETIVKKNEFTKLGAKGLNDRGKNLQIIMGLNVMSVLRNIKSVMENEPKAAEWS